MRYEGARYPGAPGVNGLEGGANCQQFAYELLRHFGRTVPAFRSSELWADGEYTREVTDLEALDLLLFNSTDVAHGAHIAVYLGDGTAVHLSRRVGRAEVRPLERLRDFEDYRCFIGAKRTLR